MNEGFFKNLAVASAMLMCLGVAIVALHMAEQANSRAETLSAKVEVQESMLSVQDGAMKKMLTMSSAQQGLIEGILDNQEGIIDLVVKRSKSKRVVASTAP